MPGERHCPWCGALQTRLHLAFEFRRQGEWVRLDPPRLMQGQRPELRVVVSHEGRSGPVHLQPGCLASSVPWLKVRGVSEQVVLEDGAEHRLPLDSFKPPKEGPRETALLSLVAEGHRAELELEILPLPEFTLEPGRVEVRTERDREVRFPIALVLQRGVSTLLAAPSLKPEFARVEWAEGVEFPVVLDSDGSRSLHGELVVPVAEARELRERVIFSLDLSCTGREDTPPRLDLEARILATPELVVEPFSQDRHDWLVVKGITEGDLLELTVGNGADARSDRTPLEIARLEILPPGGHLELRRGADLFPCTLGRSERRTLSLGLRPGLEPGREHLFTLVFHTNEPRPRHRYLAVELREPRVFDGWLAVDLGTTSTCAALVDKDMRIEKVDLERSLGAEDRHSLRSAVLYRRISEEGRDFEVGYHAWSVYLDHPGSIVLGAKRKAGDPDFTFEVVPVDEQDKVKRALRPVQVLEDLYSAVASRAAAFLARSGGTGSRMWESDHLLPTRLVLTHPSRFTQRQVDELKGAAARAFSRHLQALRPDLSVTEVDVLQEPIAAALSFLNDPASHAPWHQKAGQDRVKYHVLVYDCGGGTTDLTLLEVESWRKAVSLAPSGLEPSAAGEEAAALDLLAATPAWPDLLVAALNAEALRRADQAAPERQPGCRLPRAEEPGEEEDLKANRMVLDSFARSLAELISAAVLSGRDQAAWDRLGTSPRIASRLGLRVRCQQESRDLELRARDLLPTLEELRCRVLELAEKCGTLARLRPGDWRYRAQVRILGASGHPRFGGEEMTEAVRTLLLRRAREESRRRFPGKAVELPDDPTTVPFAQQLPARRNRATLLLWAEAVKLALAAGQQASKASPPPGEERRRLEILVGGELARVALEDLVNGNWPDLAAVEAGLQEGIQQTLEVARTLVHRALGQEPEVVLLTGRASLWPQVARLLAAAFPGARQMRPSGDLKECVVEGAALMRNTGPQSAEQPGVLLKVRDGVQMSTCRLGTALRRSGGTWFQEVLGDGLPIPEEGLVGTTRVSFPHAGANHLRILENAGREDRMSLPDGTANPDIREVHVHRFEIPEHLDMWDLDGTLVLRMLPELRLEAELTLGEHDGAAPLFHARFPSIEPGQLGRGY